MSTTLSENIVSIPSDIATVHKGFLSEQEANNLFTLLVNETDIRSKDKVLLPDLSTTETQCGKLMFVDHELTDLNTFIAPHGRRVEWPTFLHPLRDKLEEMLQMEFNVCVGLYYYTGEQWIDYHHDYTAFGSTKIVPSLSLGCTRLFSLREVKKPEQRFDIPMQNGDLVIMRENCQSDFTHAVIKEPDIKEPRINLTFRPFAWKKVKRKSEVRY